MSPDEQLLREVLRARADQVDTVDDFAGPAAALARRRTRRAVAAGAAGAAMVVGGVALATWVGGSGSPVPTPLPATRTVAPTLAPTSTPSPSATPSSTPSATATNTPVPPSDVVPWAAGSTIHLGTGTLDVGEGRRIVRFAPLEGGGALVFTDPGEPGLDRARIHGADGAVLADLGRTGAEASRDGSVVAVLDSGRVVVRDARGAVVAERSAPGFVGVSGSTVWLTAAEGGSGLVAWDVATGATRDVDVEGDVQVVSPDGRLGAGTRRAPGESRCWFVVDLTMSAAQVLLERCGDDNPDHFSPREFSSDGRLLIGNDGSDGGFFSRMVVVRVDDGESLVGPDLQGDRVDGWWWALAPDGNSILFSRNVAEPRFPANRNDLARCTLELECTRLQDRVRLGGGDVTRPLYVVGQPLVPSP